MYPDWLANMVMVKKDNCKWRICVDFTNLNKACRNDSSLLSKMDRIIDSMVGFEFLSSLDANLGYH